MKARETEQVKPSIHDTARELIRIGLQAPYTGNVREWQEELGMIQTKILSRLKEMRINSSVGIPTSEDETLICEFDSGMLIGFSILTVIKPSEPR